MSEVLQFRKPDEPDEESVSHIIEMRLAQLARDAHVVLQMVGVTSNKLKNMKASHALAAARKMRDTAELLEKACSRNT